MPPLGHLPERVRLAILYALKPLVYPIHEFVERWYHTDASLRLARIRGTAMWWNLNDAESVKLHGEGDYPTAEALIRELVDYADRQKPLPPVGRKKAAA